jgi:predicted 3-demethylubiquinone-9 3-methyltransferase (glyoxalase superfamily)
MMAKNTICLWYDGTAEEAAKFYAATFPDSRVGAIHHAPGDYPDGKKGDVLVVEFTVLGIACIGLNGGPAFRHSEAFSFQVSTRDQAETDRYWNAIVGNGGAESQCGWCKDKWGLSWQITPQVLTDAMAAGGDVAKRAFEAMMPMTKIDVAAIEAAVRGKGRGLVLVEDSLEPSPVLMGRGRGYATTLLPHTLSALADRIQGWGNHVGVPAACGMAMDACRVQTLRQSCRRQGCG